MSAPAPGLSVYRLVVSRISLVKPEKGRSLEDWLLQAMQAGRIRNRVGEPELLGILDQMDAQETKQRSTKIVVLASWAVVMSHAVAVSAKNLPGRRRLTEGMGSVCCRIKHGGAIVKSRRVAPLQNSV